MTPVRHSIHSQAESSASYSPRALQGSFPQGHVPLGHCALALPSRLAAFLKKLLSRYCITAHLSHTTLPWAPSLHPLPTGHSHLSPPSPEPLALLNASGKSQLHPSASPSHSGISYPNFRMGPFQSPMAPEHILCPIPPQRPVSQDFGSCSGRGTIFSVFRPSSSLLPWICFSFLSSSLVPLTTVVLPCYLLGALGIVRMQQRAALYLTE